MTRTYASSMWERYLNSIRHTDKARIVDNPVMKFNRDVKDGVYDDISDEEFENIKNNFVEESSFYQDKRRASSYAVFLRAFQELSLSIEDIKAIASILAGASARNGPVKYELPADIDELPFE